MWGTPPQIGEEFQWSRGWGSPSPITKASSCGVPSTAIRYGTTKATLRASFSPSLSTSPSTFPSSLQKSLLFNAMRTENGYSWAVATTRCDARTPARQRHHLYLPRCLSPLHRADRHQPPRLGACHHRLRPFPNLRPRPLPPLKTGCKTL